MDLRQGFIDPKGLPQDLNGIVGNAIGADATGTAALPNKFDGVFIVDAPFNVVANNPISGNGEVGIQIFGQGASGNQITANLIGTNLQGAGPPNPDNGIDGIYIQRPDLRCRRARRHHCGQHDRSRHGPEQQLRRLHQRRSAR